MTSPRPTGTDLALADRRVASGNAPGVTHLADARGMSIRGSACGILAGDLAGCIAADRTEIDCVRCAAAIQRSAYRRGRALVEDMRLLRAECFDEVAGRFQQGGGGKLRRAMRNAERAIADLDGALHDAGRGLAARERVRRNAAERRAA